MGSLLYLSPDVNIMVTIGFLTLGLYSPVTLIPIFKVVSVTFNFYLKTFQKLHPPIPISHDYI